MVAIKAVIEPPVLVHPSWEVAVEGGRVTAEGVSVQVRPAEGFAVTDRLTVPENELPPAIVMVDPAELPESVNT
jgi:hypothetical protein